MEMQLHSFNLLVPSLFPRSPPIVGNMFQNKVEAVTASLPVDPLVLGYFLPDRVAIWQLWRFGSE